MDRRTLMKSYLTQIVKIFMCHIPFPHGGGGGEKGGGVGGKLGGGGGEMTDRKWSRLKIISRIDQGGGGGEGGRGGRGKALGPRHQEEEKKIDGQRRIAGKVKSGAKEKGGGKRRRRRRRSRGILEHSAGDAGKTAYPRRPPKER